MKNSAESVLERRVSKLAILKSFENCGWKEISINASKRTKPRRYLHANGLKRCKEYGIFEFIDFFHSLSTMAFDVYMFLLFIAICVLLP